MIYVQKGIVIQFQSILFQQIQPNLCDIIQYNSKMNTKNGQFKRMYSKFQQLKQLDPDYKSASKQQSAFPLSPQQSPLHPRAPTKHTLKKPPTPTSVSHAPQSTGNQIIYTQSQISKQVAKLKPYLALKNDILTSQELEQIRNKEISQQNYKMMSELAILENRKLCEVVDLQRDQQIAQIPQRQQKQKQGWIFQLFYRTSTNPRDDISRKQFQSGYAVTTQIVQIYESLTFDKHILKIIPSSITMVKYGQQSNYETITIEQGTFKVQLGFLDNKKFDLFDRMLFLQKNMSRSTSTRLFQNQLIKSIYVDYEKDR